MIRRNFFGHLLGLVAGLFGLGAGKSRTYGTARFYNHYGQKIIVLFDESIPIDWEKLRTDENFLAIPDDDWELDHRGNKRPCA